MTNNLAQSGEAVEKSSCPSGRRVVSGNSGCAVTSDAFAVETVQGKLYFVVGRRDAEAAADAAAGSGVVIGASAIGIGIYAVTEEAADTEDFIMSPNFGWKASLATKSGATL